jgi:hypothetical protein
MNSQSQPRKKLVSTGEAFRVAPSQDGKPAAQFWKFWVTGSEIYATSRSGGNIAKISIHESGQIHMRFEGKDLQQLAPSMPLPNEQWLHAFELRFLLSADAYSPPTEKLKNKRAFLIDVPSDSVLIMNLLIGASSGIALPQDLFAGAEPVWQATLRNQRTAVLVVRVLEMDQQNRDEITFARQSLNPKANFSKPPVAPYIEFRRVVWSEKGGNVVLVIPLGKEAVRVNNQASQKALPGADAVTRKVVISSPSVKFPIAAPNGALIGTLSIVGMRNELTLEKNVEVRGPLGAVTLTMNVSNLIVGQSFRTPPIRRSCIPSIDGAQPRSWEYSLFSYFDGARLRAEIRQMSTAFRNANVPEPMPSLCATEEIVMAVPADGLVLETQAAEPQSSTVLIGSFLLRNIDEVASGGQSSLDSFQAET